MSSLKSTDRQDKVLFRKMDNKGKTVLEVAVTNLLSAKNKDDVKLDPIYINSYDSSKYTNVSTIKNVKINPAVYVTVSYINYEENNSKEEVFISPYDLSILVDYLKDLNDMMTSNTFFDKKNTIKPDKEEDYVESGAIGRSEKVLFAFPISLRNDNNVKDRACMFCINDEEKNLILNDYDVYNLYMIFHDMTVVDLLQMSDSLMILSMIALGSGTSSSDEEDERPARRGRGSAVGRTPSRRGVKRRNIKDDEEEEDIDDEDDTEVVDDADESVFENDEDNEEEVVRTPKKRSSKKSSKTSSKTKTSKKATSKKKSTKVSINDIMDEADNLEYDDDDEDIDFGDDEE